MALCHKKLRVGEDLEIFKLFNSDKYGGANILYSDVSVRFNRGSESLNQFIQDADFNPMESGNEDVFRDLVQELE